MSRTNLPKSPPSQVTPDEEKFAAVHRINQKMIKGGSVTADVATKIFNSTLQTIRRAKRSDEFLNQAIREILSSNLALREPEIIVRLRENGFRFNTAENEITWLACKTPASISGLKDRICRIKKMIRSPKIALP